MNTWYSAMLNFVVAIEGEGDVHRSRSVIVFRAKEDDFEAARARAIEIGRARETEYLNAEGERVQWALEEIETIDTLGNEITDGREVYHEFSDPFPRSDLANPLNPDLSTPGPSGV
jgi:hypothetical protein